MTAQRDRVDAVEDILRNLALAREFVAEALTVDELEADPKTPYSVVRALEVVGEATKRVPVAVRDLDPAIPWREMAGMRDPTGVSVTCAHTASLLLRNDLPSASRIKDPPTPPPPKPGAGPCSIGSRRSPGRNAAGWGRPYRTLTLVARRIG